MLEKDNTVLVVIDVQGRLAELMHEKDELFDNLRRLIEGAKVLGLPIVLTEQNPAGLGPTRPEVSSLIADVKPIAKLAFSCCGQKEFVDAVRITGKRQVLLAGIETHVCVYQTALDLIGKGYEVHVVADAVSSRKEFNKMIGLEKMRHAGALVTCVETALFELLRVAEGPEFKAIIKIVK